MKINPKTVLRTILISFLSLIALALISATFFYFYSNKIVQKTGKNIPYFFNTVAGAYQRNPYRDSKFINILVLGLDKRDDKLEKTETTDTIILASINTESGKINLTSLPRDLWNYEQKMKINGIYPVSLTKERPFDFIESEYQKIYGQKIDKTIIVTTSNLIDLVSTIGGVDVNLEKGFKDELYPNQAHIDNPDSDAPIYKTIEFKTGVNHLDQSNITEFVRSRKGVDAAGEEETDTGRVVRQQLLIDSIMTKIKSKDFVSNYNNLINLYNFWQKNISTNMTDFDLAAIGLKIKSKINSLVINKITIPIGDNQKEGLIYHPESTNFTKQWIYLPSDSNDYSKIHDFIKTSLN